jgi:hypothetical protein
MILNLVVSTTSAAIRENEKPAYRAGFSGFLGCHLKGESCYAATSEVTPEVP